MQGDPADAVYYIWAGKISITVLSQEGKRAAVAILRAGDFFGEACLAGQLQRTATARALTAWQAAEKVGRWCFQPDSSPFAPS